MPCPRSPWACHHPVVLHFRWSTHGSNGKINVHPHPLAGGSVGLVHNGILSNFLPPKGAKVSDRVWFCKTVLMGRDGEQLMSERFGKVLAEMIGGGNKLVLMDGGGSVSIVNESAGVWDGCCWFSNDCYQSAYGACKAGYRGLSFRDLPLWEQAVTQGDVWDGVDADLLEEEEWRALADERAWREAREAMRRDG